MLAYFLRVFRTDSFRDSPGATIGRAMEWIIFHIIPKRSAKVSISVGSRSFVLDLPPLLRNAGSTGIFVQRTHYEPLLRFCHQFVSPGQVVFDCGANQGIYTCAFAALVGPTGRVVAFEPQDYAVTALENNIRLNGFTQVTVEHAAVSDTQGAAVLDLTRGPTSASIVRDFGQYGVQTVPTTTLAAVAERLAITRLDLLKMDIEGAEYHALKGGEDLISRFRPIIVLEASPHEAQWTQIVALLSRYDYQPHLFNSIGKLESITDLSDDQPDVVFLPRQ